MLERKRLELQLKEVMGAFKKFYQQRNAAKDGQPDPEKSFEAISILTAALNSAEESVRESALENLKRLTGKDFGMDPTAWQAWLAETQADFAAQQEN